MLPGPKYSKVPAEKEQDAQFMQSVGLIPTKNNKGCMFLQIDGYVDEWIKEWKKDGKPLLDLGCAYGIHTLKALRSGCDVIAVDMDSIHIDEMRRSAALPENSCGKLISSHVMRLPLESPSLLLPEASVSAVLFSEVLHFLQVGEPVKVFKQAYHWLVPGCRLFVSTSSAKGYDNMFASGAKMNGGSTEKEVMELVRKCTDEELIQIAPTFATLPKHSGLKTLYCVTTEELAALARIAGFVIEKLEYYSPRKYQVLYPEEEECVLLVAQKPL